MTEPTNKPKTTDGASAAPVDSSDAGNPRVEGAPAAASSDPIDKIPPVPPLTPEEQMERFAEDLKENDWGHQPC